MAPETESDEPAAAEPTPGELQLGVAGRGDLRWAAVELAGPLEDARRRLDLSPIAAVALGRALAAATLVLRFTTKAQGRLVLEALGDGPLRKVVAEVDTEGRLRGLVGEPRLATPADGRMNIGWAVGQGILRITRESAEDRYTSHVELVSGEIGRDLVHYLNQSQQIRSAALLGVLPRPDGIAAAGGVLVEVFPGTPEETLARLERNIAELDGVSVYLEDGGIAGLRDAVLAGFDRDDLERHTIAYRCRCSEQRLFQALADLPASDLDAVTGDDGRCVAECAFCGANYEFARGDFRVN